MRPDDEEAGPMEGDEAVTIELDKLPRRVRKKRKRGIKNPESDMSALSGAILTNH